MPFGDFINFVPPLGFLATLRSQEGVGQALLSTDGATWTPVLEVPGTGEHRVRVDGPITALTAEGLAKDLQRLSRNGTRGLVVDLTGVTVLASAGVAALQHAIRRGRDHDRELRLYAPPRSPAQHVLTLTALPHLTTDPDGGPGESP